MHSVATRIEVWYQQLTGRGDQGDRGASLVEYALLLGLIAVVCILALIYLGERTSDSLSSVGNSFSAGN